jgi:hypothetical protein
MKCFSDWVWSTITPTWPCYPDRTSTFLNFYAWFPVSWCLEILVAWTFKNCYLRLPMMSLACTAVNLIVVFIEADISRFSVDTSFSPSLWLTFCAGKRLWMLHPGCPECCEAIRGLVNQWGRTMCLLRSQSIKSKNYLWLYNTGCLI